MAAQTLTAASNYDGPTLMLGLANGEAITVNGGALTIDSDVRWGQNAAVFGSITVSATLGGSVLFEGRNVWELPYTASTGSVPTQAAFGSNGVTGGTSGATGEMLRVWGTGLEPLAAGGAMPASGWVKLRSKAGTFTAGEVVTLPGGATITISGPGKRSWLHIVGAEAGAITIPRLADVKWRGEWYELGTTNGADGQTFEFPVADLCPAIWVEKYAGAYALLGDSGLEPWLNAGPRWATSPQQVATDVRGKYFGQVASTGVITIALRTGNACGYKPASGLKVFVPNLILGNSTSANWAANTINATLATRYETATTQGGAVDVQGASCNWFLNMVSASAVSIKATSLLDAFIASNVAERPVLSDVAVGLSPSTTGYSPATLTALYYGLTMERVRMARVVQGTFSVWTDLYDMQLDDVQLEAFGAAGAVNRSANTTLVARRCRGVMNRPVIISLALSLETSIGLMISDPAYADNLVGSTQSATSNTPFAPNTGCKDVVVSGFSSFGGLPNVHPYGAIAYVTAGTDGFELVDVGSPTSPYDCGSANQMGGAAAISGCQNSLLRRVYLSGNRSEPVAVNNTTDGLTLINVWGDSDKVQTLDANNVVSKGCKWAPVSNGQSAVYGTLWQDQFTGGTTGAITITCNEPTTSTAGEVSTALAPGSGWTAAGGLSMASLGDAVTWTMSYFALGHTALANAAPTITGTNVANHALEFQADTGSGWSAWADMTGANLAAVGAINPATGIKLKVRATVTTASASNLLTNIRIDTVTDATSQQVQYPITSAYTLTLENVAVGSQVHVETVAGAAVYSITAVGSSVVLPLQAYETGSPLNNLRIKVRKGSSSPFYQPWETLATATPGSASIYVTQIPDE